MKATTHLIDRAIERLTREAALDYLPKELQAAYMTTASIIDKQGFKRDEYWPESFRMPLTGVSPSTGLTVDLLEWYTKFITAKVGVAHFIHLVTMHTSPPALFLGEIDHSGVAQLSAKCLAEITVCPGVYLQDQVVSRINSTSKALQ